MFDLSIFTSSESVKDSILKIIKSRGYYCHNSMTKYNGHLIFVPNLNANMLNEMLSIADDNGADFTEF